MRHDTFPVKIWMLKRGRCVALDYCSCVGFQKGLVACVGLTIVTHEEWKHVKDAFESVVSAPETVYVVLASFFPVSIHDRVMNRVVAEEDIAVSSLPVKGSDPLHAVRAEMDVSCRINAVRGHVGLEFFDSCHLYFLIDREGASCRRPHPAKTSEGNVVLCVLSVFLKISVRIGLVSRCGPVFHLFVGDNLRLPPPLGSVLHPNHQAHTLSDEV